MIEFYCSLINLKPIYIEPGYLVREFDTESVQFKYMIPDYGPKLLDQDIRRLRDKIFEDLANISYKGKVYYRASYLMEFKRDRCAYLVFDCLKIAKEKPFISQEGIEFIEEITKG